MLRRSALTVILAGLASPLLLFRRALAGNSEWMNAEVLKASLQTATPEEEGFIGYVLGLVQQGVLPPEIVQSAYLWAKRKPKYKFQYFKRVVIQLAAARGIHI